MGKEVNQKGKEIIKEILKETSFELRESNVGNVDYLLNNNIGIKVRTRDRLGQIYFKDSYYEKIDAIRKFDNACKDNNLEPYYCIIQILKKSLNIFIFNLENVRKYITDSGFNIKIKENDVTENKGIYDGYLWRYTIIGDLFINNKFVKDNIKLLYSGEEIVKKELEDKLNKIDRKSYNELVKEINIINSLENLSETEKEQLVKTRIGHSELKELLVKKECKCRICGVSDKRFLIASHIKRWTESNDKERVDVNNAFLLCPDHDWLFDKFYISFDDEGNIILAENIDKETYNKLKITNMDRVILNDENKKYLKWHRKQFHEKNRNITK